MRLSGTELEIDCKEVKDSFPATEIYCDWSCDTEEWFDDIENKNKYDFNNYSVVAWFYNDDNDEVIFIPTDDQILWIIPDVETAANEEFNNQF